MFYGGRLVEAKHGTVVVGAVALQRWLWASYECKLRQNQLYGGWLIGRLTLGFFCLLRVVG